MVEKVVVRMGCLVEREEEEGGVVVVLWLLLLLEWRRRWRGEWWWNWWKKLVVEEMEGGGWPAKEAWAAVGFSVGGKEEENNEREKERSIYIYKGEVGLLQHCHSKLYKRDLRLLHKKLRPHEKEIRVWAICPDARMKTRVWEKRKHRV